MNLIDEILWSSVTITFYLCGIKTTWNARKNNGSLLHCDHKIMLIVVIKILLKIAHVRHIHSIFHIRHNVSWRFYLNSSTYLRGMFFYSWYKNFCGIIWIFMMGFGRSTARKKFHRKLQFAKMLTTIESNIWENGSLNFSFPLFTSIIRHFSSKDASWRLRKCIFPTMF